MIQMTQHLEDFLKFDLGELDASLYPNVELDIPYMTNGKQVFDLYMPDGNKPFPLIIVIHGGGWISGYRRSKFMGPMIQPVFKGVAIACISYTLALEKPFPQAVYDIKTAIRYFKANGERLGIDPSKIILWGESAGANLAALCGLTTDTDLHDLSQGWSEYSEKIDGVIAHYGVYDFLTIDRQLVENGVHDDWPMSSEDSPASCFIGQPILKDIEVTRKANPMSYVKGNHVPFFLQHGKKDTMVPWQQTRDFAAALSAQGNEVELDYIDDAVHTDIAFFSHQEIEKIMRFCERVWVRK